MLRRSNSLLPEEAFGEIRTREELGLANVLFLCYCHAQVMTAIGRDVGLGDDLCLATKNAQLPMELRELVTQFRYCTGSPASSAAFHGWREVICKNGVVRDSTPGIATASADCRIFYDVFDWYVKFPYNLTKN